MIFLFFLLLICIFYGFSLKKISKFHENYIDKTQSTCIKGIFAVIILFSHMRSYMQLSNNIFDSSFDYVLNIIGQLMVTAFLFYSGYGIFESYKNKNYYENTFFKKRIFKTWSHFVLAVFLFLVVDVYFNINYETTDYIFCWIGWKSIGNSKWFVFDILTLYLATFILFVCIKAINRKKAIDKETCLLITIWPAVIIIIIVLYFAKRNEGSWWYDVLLTYPCGMTYSYYKKNINKMMQNRNYYFVLLFVGAIFVITHLMDSFISYNVCACMFVLLITFITMKIKIENRILIWLGEKSFSIYILQRLPMIIMSQYGINNNRYLFAGFSIVFALVVATVFDKILNIIDKKVIYNK